MQICWQYVDFLKRTSRDLLQSLSNSSFCKYSQTHQQSSISICIKSPIRKTEIILMNYHQIKHFHPLGKLPVRYKTPSKYFCSCEKLKISGASRGTLAMNEV